MSHPHESSPTPLVSDVQSPQRRAGGGQRMPLCEVRSCHLHDSASPPQDSLCGVPASEIEMTEARTLEKLDIDGLLIGVCLRFDPSFFIGNSFFLISVSTGGVSTPASLPEACRWNETNLQMCSRCFQTMSPETILSPQIFCSQPHSPLASRLPLQNLCSEGCWCLPLRN